MIKNLLQINAHEQLKLANTCKREKCAS